VGAHPWQKNNDGAWFLIGKGLNGGMRGVAVANFIIIFQALDAHEVRNLAQSEFYMKRGSVAYFKLQDGLDYGIDDRVRPRARNVMHKQDASNQFVWESQQDGFVICPDAGNEIFDVLRQKCGSKNLDCDVQ